MADIAYHPVAWLLELPAGFDPDEHEYPGELPEDTAYEISDFIKSGRNIFHLEPELVSLFEKTSIDDLILEDIQLPYEAFFIYFGEEAGIFAPDYFDDLSEITDSPIAIEGAYVNRSFHFARGFEEGSFNITLVPARQAGEDEALYTYNINFELHAHPSGFIRDGFKSKIMDQYKSIFINPWERRGELEWKRIEKIGGKTGKTFEQVKNEWSPDKGDIAWKSAATNALNIMFNAIVYLTTYQADVVEDYPAFYPQKLVEKTRGPAKQAHRAESKLNSLGFRKVKFIGRGIKQYFKAQAEHGDISTHWRRGHWRRQPHGDRELGLRKLIWIKPTIVNPQKDYLGVPGHIYSTADK